jgi:hypothetical protein
VTGEQIKPFRFLPEYADCIANAANSWSYLEYYINTTIWDLAKVEPALGACITSQIFSIPARVDAVVSLLKLRKADSKLIGKVNKFAETFRGANEARNRIIHDVWLNDNVDTHYMGRLTITAKKSLEFDVQTVPITELKADLAEIERVRAKFAEIRREILAAIPSLPEMSPTELRPINEHPHPPQTRSTD